MVWFGIFAQLHQHGAEAIDRIHRRAIGARHRWQGVKGAENKAGTVNQNDATRGFGGGRTGAGRGGICHASRALILVKRLAGRMPDPGL